MYAGLRRPAWGVFLALLLPLAYLAYMTRMRVMMVRNLLLLVPFIAIFAARGLDFLAARTTQGDKTRRQAVLGAACGLLLVFNGSYLESAARSIRERATRTPAALLLEDLRGPLLEQRVHLSALVEAALQGATNVGELEAWRPGYPNDRDRIALFRRELSASTRWDFDILDTRWYGARDVNYVFYPSFPSEKILVLSIGHARVMGVAVDELLARQ